MKSYKVIDLGTKTGGALDVYRQRGAKLYKLPRSRPEYCLGVDAKGKYRAQVEKKRYNFLEANVLKGFPWPEAQVYLAWDFLEHLPSIKDSKEVLKKMLELASVCVWLRCPSFEQDDEGEAQLARHGLRFTWTKWKGHRSPFLAAHVYETIDEIAKPGDSWHIRLNQMELIKNSSDPRIVPIKSPIDTVKYHPSLGPKKMVKFSPNVVGQHQFIITKKGSS